MRALAILAVLGSLGACEDGTANITVTDDGDLCKFEFTQIDAASREPSGCQATADYRVTIGSCTGD